MCHEILSNYSPRNLELAGIKISNWIVGVKILINTSFLLSTGKEPSPVGKNQRSIEFVDFHCRKGVGNLGRAFILPS